MLTTNWLANKRTGGPLGSAGSAGCGGALAADGAALDALGLLGAIRSLAHPSASQSNPPASASRARVLLTVPCVHRAMARD